jgi:hypothetical protein
MASLLSIDYDFLIPHGMYDEITFPDGEKVPGELVFDWQMSETRDPIMDEMIWQGRAASFERWGLDIRALTAPPISVQDFVTEISIRLNDALPSLYRGDSHGWAAILARDYSKEYGPLDVVNLDAHHDLGYMTGIVKENKKTGAIHCDDWALIGLAQGWIKNYTLVYPDWLGMQEYADRKLTGARSYKDRISVTTWSEWKAEIDNPVVTYFCRSSSWVPPWYDPGFQELHEEFGYAECIDCLLGQAGSPFDTCKLREWDWDEFAKLYAERESMREQILALQKELA